jgi:hypothetical protein
VAGVDPPEEIVDAGPTSIRVNSRLGLRLSEAEAAELTSRLEEVVDSYATRAPTPDGELYGMYVSVHRLQQPD